MISVMYTAFFSHLPVKVSRYPSFAATQMPYDAIATGS